MNDGYLFLQPDECHKCHAWVGRVGPAYFAMEEHQCLPAMPGDIPPPSLCDRVLTALVLAFPAALCVPQLVDGVLFPADFPRPLLWAACLSLHRRGLVRVSPDSDDHLLSVFQAKLDVVLAERKAP